MPDKIAKLLEDMYDAAQFVADVTHDVTEAGYRRNCMLRHSIERNREIVGEAMRRLAQHDPSTHN
jgi:uncharacterized protein with HEPN domain